MVDIPAFGVMPFKLPGPKYEHEVASGTAPVQDSKKTKRANKGPAIIASNRRGPHREPEIPMQLLSARGPELEEIQYTPRGTGSFVDPLAVKETAAEEAPVRFSHIPTRMEMPEPVREDTFISRALAPDDDELEAARNGMRWHWALEHRFMPPGSKWNETVLQGADRENAWLSQMLKQRAQDLKGVTQPIASERQRATMSNMWKTFLKDIQNGYFDAYGGTAEKAQEWADNFKKRYESIFGEGTSIDLAPEASVLGKRTELERKHNRDLTATLNQTKQFDDKLREWVWNGDLQNKTKSRLIKNELDKLAQSMSATLGGDSKNMSEAEKVRIQILYLPESGMNNVKETVRRYREFLTNIMNLGEMREWSQSNRGIVRELEAAAGALPSEDEVEVADRGDLADIAATFGTFIAKALSSKAELPHNVAAALEAGRRLYETYMDNMVLAANVDPAVAHHMVKYIHDLAKRTYNFNMEQARRPERWNYDIDEMDYAALAREIPADELLDPPVFPTGEVLGPVQGGDITSNPSSQGEQKPAPKSDVKDRGKVTTTTSGRKGF